MRLLRAIFICGVGIALNGCAGYKSDLPTDSPLVKNPFSSFLLPTARSNRVWAML